MTLAPDWDSEASREVGKLCREKRQGFSSPLIGGCWDKEVASWLIRSRPSYMIGLGNIFGLLHLILSWKLGRKTGKVAVINQFWASWVDCFKCCALASWTVTIEVVGRSSIVVCSLAIFLHLLSLKGYQFWTDLHLF